MAMPFNLREINKIKQCMVALLQSDRQLKKRSERIKSVARALLILF